MFLEIYFGQSVCLWLVSSLICILSFSFTLPSICMLRFLVYVCEMRNTMPDVGRSKVKVHGSVLRKLLWKQSITYFLRGFVSAGDELLWNHYLFERSWEMCISEHHNRSWSFIIEFCVVCTRSFMRVEAPIQSSTHVDSRNKLHLSAFDEGSNIVPSSCRYISAQCLLFNSWMVKAFRTVPFFSSKVK